ncbi:MAG: Fic family protein [Kofleriaceae bacterium]
MVCAHSWSEVCAQWWSHPTDDRLRNHVAEQLSITSNALSEWQAAPFDRALLLRAHEHVTAMRAATEGNAIYRNLVTGALRSIPVVAHQRDGLTTVFPSAELLPRLIDELRGTFDALPHHPFVRAAWINQAIGAVHPFVDANGGTARFLSSIQLTRACLPPFVLTELQRRTSYVEAVVAGDSGLPPLLHVVHDIVQQQLARVLTKESAVAEWTPRGRELAAHWLARTDRAWRSAAGLELERDDGMTLASFVRRGYRIPFLPTPRLARWSSTTPIPFQFCLAISPTLAGDATFTLASVTASVGANDELAPILHEPIAAVFVAAPIEPLDVVNARFDHWVAKRIDQSVRGLAAWM